MHIRSSFVSLIAISCLASSCSQPSPAKAYESGGLVVLAPTRAEGGVSRIVAHFRGGHLKDPPTECGQSHLQEHMLGRAMYDALSDMNLPFGYEVNAATGVDQIVLVTTVGGGEEGLAAVMRGLDAIKDAQVLQRFEAQERELLNIELKVPAPLSDAAAALVHSMKAADQKRIDGSCSPPGNSAGQLRTTSLTAITVGSEIDKQSILQLLSQYRMDELVSEGAVRPELQNILGKAKVDVPTSLFWVPFAPDADSRRQAVFEASLGFWTQLDASSLANEGQISLTPFGQQGYFVRFDVPLSLKDIQMKVGSTSKKGLLNGKTMRSIGREKICALIGNVRSDYLLAASNTATNAWARSAALLRSCSGSAGDDGVDNEWLTNMVYQENIIPIPFPITKSAFSPTLGSVISSHRRSLSICGLSSDEDARFRDYYEQVGLRYLLGQYRFRFGNVLTGFVKQRPKAACIEYDLIVSTGFSFSPDDPMLGGNQPSLSAAWNSAHKAYCLTLPLRERQSRQDADCKESASEKSLAYAQKHFGSGWSNLK